MGSKYSHVFEPINIRGVVFKNRLQLAPQSPGLADENGMVTDEFVDFFRPIARGGAAIVTIGNSPVDLSESKDEARHLDLGNDDILVPLSRFADMVTDYGGIASIEINHAGIDAHPEYTNNQVFAPSAGYSPAELILGPMMGRKPVRAQAMSFEKVQQTVQKYIDAAARVQQAGFKMVLVHGGHANLIGQFSSPVYNHRTDEYGGSLENRARFAIEILDGIRARCGEGLVIEFRISADEIHPDGMHFEETLQYIDLIKEKIDILHVSAGMHADFQYIPNWMQPYNVSRMLNVHYAEKIKKQYGDYFKVCAVGSIINVANADEIIASGKADFCAMARPYLADPEMPRKYATGHEEDHRPCIRCQFCSDRLMQPAVCSCAVNPQMGRRSFMPTGRIAPALAKKKVAVIGGGVAGITAALTLSERGHDVALYERDSVLGGTLIAATALPVKQDLRDYLQYLRVQAEKSAVNIMLDTEATPETIAEAGYDGLFIAVGAEPLRPSSIPGIDKPHVHWAPEADQGLIEVGQNVVVIGAGAVGVESALFQHDQGKNVSIYEMASHTGNLSTSAGVGAFVLEKELAEKGLAINLNHKLHEITDDAVLLIDLRSNDLVRIPADTVLLALGMRSRDQEVARFRHSAPETDVFVIGDCKVVGNVGTSNSSAFGASYDY